MTFVRNHQSLTNKTSNTNGLSVGIDASNASVAGNVLIAAITFDNVTNASTPTVSSIAKMSGDGGTWTQIGSVNSSTATGGAGCRTEVWAIKTTVAWTANTTYTVTLSNAVTAKACVMQEHSEIDLVVRGTSGSGTSTSGAPSAATSGTALVSGDLVIGAVGHEDNTSPADDSDTTNGSWSTGRKTNTTTGGAATNVGVNMQYKYVTATGTQTYNPSVTGDSGAICVAGLKPHTITTPSTVAGTTSVGAPTLITSSTVSATTVAGTTAVGAPTFTSTATAQPGAVVGSTAIPTPTVTTTTPDATATPDTVTGTATLGAPTIGASSTLTPTTVAGTTTVPTAKPSIEPFSIFARAVVAGQWSTSVDYSSTPDGYLNIDHLPPSLRQYGTAQAEVFGADVYNVYVAVPSSGTVHGSLVVDSGADGEFRLTDATESYQSVILVWDGAGIYLWRANHLAGGGLNGYAELQDVTVAVAGDLLEWEVDYDSHVRVWLNGSLAAELSPSSYDTISGSPFTMPSVHHPNLAWMRAFDESGYTIAHGLRDGSDGTIVQASSTLSPATVAGAATVGAPTITASALLAPATITGLAIVGQWSSTAAPVSTARLPTAGTYHGTLTVPTPIANSGITVFSPDGQDTAEMAVAANGALSGYMQEDAGSTYFQYETSAGLITAGDVLEYEFDLSDPQVRVWRAGTLLLTASDSSNTDSSGTVAPLSWRPNTYSVFVTDNASITTGLRDGSDGLTFTSSASITPANVAGTTTSGAPTIDTGASGATATPATVLGATTVGLPTIYFELERPYGITVTTLTFS